MSRDAQIWARDLNVDCGITSVDKLLLLIIAMQIDEQFGLSYMSLKTLASRACVKSKNTVRTALERMEKLDLLQIRASRWHHNNAHGPLVIKIQPFMDREWVTHIGMENGNVLIIDCGMDNLFDDQDPISKFDIGGTLSQNLNHPISNIEPPLYQNLNPLTKNLNKESKDYWLRFKKVYPRSDFIEQAHAKFTLLTAEDANVAIKIVSAAEAYAAQREGKDQKYTMYADNWLKKDKWINHKVPVIKKYIQPSLETNQLAQEKWENVKLSVHGALGKEKYLDTVGMMELVELDKDKERITIWVGYKPSVSSFVHKVLRKNNANYLKFEEILKKHYPNYEIEYTQGDEDTLTQPIATDKENNNG